MTTQPPRRGRAAGLSLLLLLAALALAVALLAGCGSSGSDASSNASPSAAAAGGSITVTDDAGAEVTLTQPAQRVVSLAPANTEVVFAIGAGDKLVAGTSYDDYPEEAKALPKIGDFANPSVEKIIAMKPDLVLAAGGVQEGLRDRLEKLGIVVYMNDAKTYDAVIANIGELGQLLGVQASADQVAADMTAAAASVAAEVGSLADKPLTFVEIYSKPLMTAGSGTYVDDLVTRAAGVNLGATAGEGYPNYNSETLIAKDPAVYIAVAGAQSSPGDIAKRPGYSGLSAVKNEQVYVIDDNLVTRPGPRLAEGLQQLAKMIHPEAYQAQ